MGASDGLLIQARQNPLIYTLIILIITVVLLFVLLHFSLAYLTKLHSSPEWIEAHKKLPTKRINVKKIAAEVDLSISESKTLLYYCRKYSIPNIEYVAKNFSELDSYFGKIIKEEKDDPNFEDAIQKLFSIRFKIEKTKIKENFISTTKLLKPETELYYFDDNKKFIFKIVSSDKNGMFLSFPQTMVNTNLKPNPLNKLKLTFNGKNGVNYGFISRLIRYEKQADETELMYISHSSSLKPIQRRMTKRIVVNSPCAFEAAAKITDKKGNYHFEIKEHNYKGMIIDISSTGCKMACKIPIKIGQYLNIRFDLGGKVQGNAIGTIVMTNKSPEQQDIFILHIKFLELAQKTKNDINAVVYKYL